MRVTCPNCGSPVEPEHRFVQCADIASTPGGGGAKWVLHRDNADRALFAVLDMDSSTDDQSLEALADWGDATARLLIGDQAAESAVHDTIEQLLGGGRTYTAWHLVADAAGLMNPRPIWIDHLAADAKAGGARRTASQLEA